MVSLKCVGTFWIIHFWLYSFVKGFNIICCKFWSICIDEREWTEDKEYLCSKGLFSLPTIQIGEIFNKIAASLAEFNDFLWKFVRNCNFLQHLNAMLINDMKGKIHPTLTMNNIGFVPLKILILAFPNLNFNKKLQNLSITIT
jgi:hypothetical protein